MVINGIVIIAVKLQQNTETYAAMRQALLSRRSQSEAEVPPARRSVPVLEWQGELELSAIRRLEHLPDQ